MGGLPAHGSFPHDPHNGEHLVDGLVPGLGEAGEELIRHAVWARSLVPGQVTHAVDEGARVYDVVEELGALLDIWWGFGQSDLVRPLLPRACLVVLLAFLWEVFSRGGVGRGGHETCHVGGENLQHLVRARVGQAMFVLEGRRVMRGDVRVAEGPPVSRLGAVGEVFPEGPFRCLRTLLGLGFTYGVELVHEFVNSVAHTLPPLL